MQAVGGVCLSTLIRNLVTQLIQQVQQWGGIIRGPITRIGPVESPWLQPQPIFPPIFRPGVPIFPRIVPEYPQPRLPIPEPAPRPRPEPQPDGPIYGPPIPPWLKCEKPWERPDPDEEEEKERRKGCLDECERIYKLYGARMQGIARWCEKNVLKTLIVTWKSVFGTVNEDHVKRRIY